MKTVQLYHGTFNFSVHPVGFAKDTVAILRAPPMEFSARTQRAFEMQRFLRAGLSLEEAMAAMLHLRTRWWFGWYLLYCYWVGSLDFNFLDSLTSTKLKLLLGDLQHPSL